MYAHKVIESMDSLIDRSDKFSRLIGERWIYEKDLISKSHKFHFGEVAFNHDELLNKFERDYEKMVVGVSEYLKLPFKSCWFDWYIIRPNKQQHKMGFLLQDSNEEGVIKISAYNTLIKLKLSNQPIWTLYEYELILKINKKLEKISFETNTPEELKPKTRKDTERVWSEQSVIVLDLVHFLLLLNCKNIKYEAVDPEEKLNKKRIKRGKGPLFRYHILKVNTGDTTRKVYPERDEKLWKLPKRWVRGHFKRYTKERPLFGKVHGLFWFESREAGSLREGFVDKDYKIIH